MKNYDTVIFDMDGTLLDTLEDLADSVNAALIKYGRQPRTVDEVRRFVGNGVLKLMERAVVEGSNASDFDEIFNYFKSYYSEHSQIKTKTYAGIFELVSELKEKGYKMAIVSNKFHDAVCALSKLYFGDLLPVSIGENEAAGIRKKPAPDTVNAALEMLGSVKERAVYIGDSEVDYETAVNSGMDCILVSWGFRERALLESLTPQTIADDPMDIMEYLQKNRA